MLAAMRCPNGHVTYPEHPRCPECGEPGEGTVDLSDRTATVVTWTTSTATPPGVREPNHLAIVEFEADGQPVRAVGQLTEPAESGATVEPVHVDQLREPGAGIREPDSQDWGGYRFDPA
ncbi:MAG: Zn-ribbon domain-containing OB-fold protein [Halobacteriaceae archaeon]